MASNKGPNSEWNGYLCDMQNEKGNGAMMPFARPLYVMAKPAGAACNLGCSYCYYLEKRLLFAPGRPMKMSDAVLERYVKDYIGSQTGEDVMFTWHGGEPLLRNLAFYRRVTELQKRFAGRHHVFNCIQTNGTLLTAEWCRFFAEQGWLVGVSVDGPAGLHDEFRRNRKGRGSWRDVMRGIELLKEYGVEWNAMATVNAITAKHPHEFYEFFKSIGTEFLQFTPVVERLGEHADGRRLMMPTESEGVVAPFSVGPDDWGEFLCAVYDVWVRSDVGKIFVQMFDSTLANWVGVPPGVCTLGQSCGHAAVMEYNGDVYCCDHFVAPEFRLGNVMQTSLAEMMYAEKQILFGGMKQRELAAECRECEWKFLCNGECPRNRFVASSDGSTNGNYLCRGYRRFWRHSAPTMRIMGEAVRAGRDAAEVMDRLRGGEINLR